MEKEFVPYELAVKLKALGFDEPCFGWYEHNGNFYYCYQEGIVPPTPSKKLIKGCCLAPTFSQAFRWFREKHFKMSYVYYDLKYKFSFCIGYNDKAKEYETYEEAELACLDKLIEIVEYKSE